MTDIISITQETIQSQIYTIRGKQVMLDRGLAVLYGVETKRLNEQVKRNLDRFPADDFMFELTHQEQDSLRSQSATLKKRGTHNKYLTMVFTESGIIMLASVLRSKTAINVSIQITRAFVEMRKFLRDNAEVYHIGASLKDLGKKWFAFSKLGIPAKDILGKL